MRPLRCLVTLSGVGFDLYLDGAALLLHHRGVHDHLDGGGSAVSGQAELLAVIQAQHLRSALHDLQQSVDRLNISIESPACQALGHLVQAFQLDGPVCLDGFLDDGLYTPLERFVGGTLSGVAHHVGDLNHPGIDGDSGYRDSTSSLGLMLSS